MAWTQGRPQVSRHLPGLPSHLVVTFTPSPPPATCCHDVPELRISLGCRFHCYTLNKTRRGPAVISWIMSSCPFPLSFTFANNSGWMGEHHALSPEVEKERFAVTLPPPSLFHCHVDLKCIQICPDIELWRLQNRQNVYIHMLHSSSVPYQQNIL